MGISLQIWMASAFGLTFFVCLIVLAIRFPNPTGFQYTVFRIILSLAAAGVAAMIPGFINLDLSPTQGFLLRAGGALAVFAIVYFFNPAEIGTTKTLGKSKDIQTSGGRAPETNLPEWAEKEDADLLMAQLTMLPSSHRIVLSEIARARNGIGPSDFVDNSDLHFTRREVVYICRELADKFFVDTRYQTDYRYRISSYVPKNPWRRSNVPYSCPCREYIIKITNTTLRSRNI
jgi:hypothetical protein